MAVLTKTELMTLDVTGLGFPFFEVRAGTELDLNSLDVAYLGQPFWGHIDSATPVVLYDATKMFLMF